MKTCLAILGAAIMVIAGVYVAYQSTPWPSALYVRRAMNKGAPGAMEALEKFVPAGVSARHNLQYDANDADAYLDVFSPLQIDAIGETRPTIVWIHGGGWLAGDKKQIANYLMILAGRGYTTIGVNYALAPEKLYPTPVRQVNAALAYIKQNATQLRVDPSRLFLAGDSSGAQIAAQMAAIVSAPSYAKDMGIAPSIDQSQLRGVILYCGLYDGIALKTAQLSATLRTQLWAYFGTKQYLSDPRLEQFSVAQHITADFPPMFISVGNADWLTSQSHRFAETASALGIVTDTLFFSADYMPRAQHEYQFDLDTDAGRLALERSVKFLHDRSR